MNAPDADMQQFGAALRDARKRAGYSQDRLAAVFDKGRPSHQRNLSWWEAGKTDRISPPDPGEVWALETALGCVPGELAVHHGYTWTGTKIRPETAVMQDDTLPLETKRALLAIIKQLRNT